MRTVTYRLVDLQNATLNLGHAGENQRTRIMFDAKKLFEEYPAALPSLTVKPPVGDTYPAVVTKEGYCVYWDITDSDLIHDGIGEAQLTFTENDVKVKTYITKTKITRSLDPVGQIPTPIENWIERADDILDEAQEAAAAAESAAEHQPKIENGYWYIWNGTEYVQNVKAQGEDGAPGQDGKDGKDGADGQPGADGRDGVDATPALITVDYADLVYPVAAGTTCYHNGEMFVAKEAIQTAGAWDSSKWDKTTVEEQVSQLKSGLQGVEEDLEDTVINITPEWDQTMVISAYGTLKTVISGGQVSPNVKISKPISVKKGDVVSITGKLTNNANIAWTSQDYLNTYQGTPSFLPLSVGDSVGTRTETATVPRDGFIIVSAFVTETCTVQITRTYKNQQEENALEAIDPYLRHNYVDKNDFVPNLEKKRTNGILVYQADDKSEEDYIVNAVAYPDGTIIACRDGGDVVKIENDGTETVLLSIAYAHDWRGMFMDSNLNVYVSPHSTLCNPAISNTERGLYKLEYGGNSFTKVISLCHDVYVTKWAKNTAYAVNDVVFDNTTSVFYVCKTAHTSGNTIDLTKFNTISAWVKNHAYAIGDLVKYRNIFYRCIYAHTSGSSMNTYCFDVLTEYMDNDDTIWTMCEDAKGNLFAGVYAHSLRDNPSVYFLQKGQTKWFCCHNFIMCGTLPAETYSTAPQHVHCINYNEYDQRLYAAVGETNTVLYSTDRGFSWTDMHIPCVYGQPTYVMGVKDGLLIGSDGHYSCGVSKLATDGVTLKRCGRTAPGFIFNIRRSDVTGWLYAFTRIDNCVGDVTQCPPVEAITDSSALNAWKNNANTDKTYLQWWIDYNKWASVYYPEDAIRPQNSVMMVSKDEGETWEVFKTIKCSQNYASICGFITVGYFRDGECLVGCLLPVEGTQNGKAFVQPFVISEGKKKRTSSGFDLTGEIFIKTNTNTTIAYE